MSSCAFLTPFVLFATLRLCDDGTDARQSTSAPKCTAEQKLSSQLYNADDVCSTACLVCCFDWHRTFAKLDIRKKCLVTFVTPLSVGSLVSD